MPNKLPPFVLREKTRHGKRVFYFRRGKGPRTRLPDYASTEFDEAYAVALTSSRRPERRTKSAGTLKWLIERYRETSSYLSLSQATRRQRDNIFKGVIESAGGEDFRAITRKTIFDGRERRSATPAQARNFLDAMRGLFKWALEAEHVTVDLTAGVKNPPRRQKEGFKAWMNDDIAAYEAKWPRGTKERVWLDVLQYTGLRRGDAVRIGKQHVCDGVATIKTEKNGLEVSVPILPPLALTLATGPIGDLAFIVGERGQPLTKESFGNLFRKACRNAGIHKSAHGVRKADATRAAEAGATEQELMARFGWTDPKMASHYTKSADRKRLAQSAAEKIMNAQSPHRTGFSPAPAKNKRKSAT